MPATHEDPQLGALTRRRGRWRGEIELLGRRVPLTVVGGCRGPEEDALVIARGAADALAGSRDELEAALADHREPYEVTAVGWSLEWANVEPLAGGLTLELGLRTDGDEKHTLGARLGDGCLVELNRSVLGP